MQNVKGLRLRARLEKNMSRPFIYTQELFYVVAELP